jgi:AraC family transcriptional regulator, regulatory protein of adaptative response / methylated-DNA-[protein]-cysteine methyltransferase
MKSISASNEPIDSDWAFAAFDARNRAMDGRFVGAVKTTGIYCKPSCPARRPLRKNVAFFWTGEEAFDAGYRPCLRCRPDDVARDEAAVAQAVILLSGEQPPALAALASAVGYAPHHFHRLFKRHTGQTPAAWVRAQRLKRADDALAKGASVTDAIYTAGYAAPSRYYADRKALKPPQ